MLTTTDLTNLKLEAAIIEEEIEYENAPGSNGETVFYDVVRRILPSNEGLSLAEIKQSGSNIIELEDDLLETWNNNQLNTVIFIQNKNTKEVLQAGTAL
jgi:hypothetical protein